MILISILYGDHFNLKDAFKHIKEVVDVINSDQYTNEKGPLDYVRIMGNLINGIILESMGNVQGSIEAYKLSLGYVEDIQQSFNQISTVYGALVGNLGEAFAETGDLNSALEYQLKALNLRKKLADSKLCEYYINAIDNSLAESYYQLIQLQIRLEHLDDAKEYLTIFENLTKNVLNKNTGSKVILIQYNLAKGLIFIQNGSFEDIGQAKLFLKEIINEDVKFELIADALVPLIDITIQEYKVFQNEKIYQDLVSLIKRLEELGEINNSAQLKIYSLVVGGKMELIQGNIRKAEEMYKNALSIAKEFNLSALILESTLELEKLRKDRGIWEDNIHKTSIKERFDLLDLENYIKEGKQYITVKKGQ